MVDSQSCHLYCRFEGFLHVLTSKDTLQVEVACCNIFLILIHLIKRGNTVLIHHISCSAYSAYFCLLSLTQ